MSDESSTSLTARNDSTGESTQYVGAAGTRRPQDGTAAATARRARNRRMFNKKRESFLADLMRNVDMLVYAQLSIIYYMDCSFLRFALRAFIQFVLLTPKPAIFPDTPQSRPIGMVIGTNILCFILHAIFSRPEAGEATRGYLHGGLAMDLIGQKGPSSKLRLLLLDVLVLGLQLINLAVLLLKRRASAAAASGSAATNSNTVTATSAQVPAAAAGGGQTLDFEERGQHRSDHEAVDIELQTLNPSGSAAQRSSTTTTAPAEDPSPDVEDDDGSREQTALLSSLDQADEPDSDTHLFSAFNTGEIQIADLNIPRMVREQMIEYYHQTPVDTAATNTAAEAATARRNRLAARLGFGNDGFGFRIRIGSQTVGF